MKPKPTQLPKPYLVVGIIKSQDKKDEWYRWNINYAKDMEGVRQLIKDHKRWWPHVRIKVDYIVFHATWESTSLDKNA